ncbi:DUF4386 family protein [Nostocoides sp. F2B08]|uniref:DUF4386 family protein n=1 Tax=Nostocoides sp. F2B08 TaxID=2653936 RepID=UPI001262C6C8|nr:DUF4386 family protein [Tetrasphaera sp. F2B08]KAB7740313.1 DUF4386 family protein [Tetrasphaera sp. F2B08]
MEVISTTSAARAGYSVVVMAVLGLAWTVVEVLPPALGYTDTDDPAVMVQFLRDFPVIYQIDGVLLVMLSVAVVSAVVGVADHLRSDRPQGTALRVASIFGLFTAALLLPLAGLRMASASTLLHVDKLNTDWSEAAYLSVQMVGTQALGAGAIIALCGWAVGLCADAMLTGVLPRWLIILGLLPATRLLFASSAPFVADESAASAVLWVVYMLAVPGTTVWFLLLGITLIRHRSPSMVASASDPDTTPA